MTNSKTSSSSDYDRVKLILIKFLDGQYTLFQIREALEDYLTINFDQTRKRREIQNNTLDGIIEIPVVEADLRRMLTKYIAGEISETDLSDWAAFIFMSQVFVPEGETDEERDKAGEGPLWDILQRLMTPDIFDGLSQVVAQRYLELLE